METSSAYTDVAVPQCCSIGKHGLQTARTRTLHRFEAMIGSSAPMQEVYERIQQSAVTDVTVLITGETGTGKDLAAAALHTQSQRKDKPYLVINTGAMLPELIGSELFGYDKGAFTGAVVSKPGLFEQTHGGTVFLDEIGTMDMKAQTSLLRLLETKTLRRLGGRKVVHVDVRLIAATNEPPEEGVARGTLRQDLYYRLDVFRIELPPLRERPGDVLLLAWEFVSRFNAMYNKTVQEMAPETIHFLEQYAWPGNVRELKNVLQGAVLMAQGRVLTADLLPARIRKAPEANEAVLSNPVRLGMTLSEMECAHITTTLAALGGNKKATAQMLGISRRALYNKLKRYGLLYSCSTANGRLHGVYAGY
jgi:transcriptional regulator with PAS, ATPase and Fis domain